MAYQVLARKWRPGRFAELVGQEHVVAAITNALDNDRLHHAYLFTGTRGVGKTTIARIFSKSLNCEQGQSANPCGQCSTCVEIEQGNYVDLLEIDAASRTKVEDTRELLDNVQYKPTRGRYKVYLIDEVHMLSKHSFNALLKTLEEPPPHVKFLLATTDPQKLPITILSRCLQFNLKALSRDQIGQQLQHILQQEQIAFEESALGLLAKAAQGSMRDALSLTDQAIAQGNNQVSGSVVTDMLGLMDRQQLLKILFAIGKKDAAEVLHQAAEIDVLAPDYSIVLAELASLLHQIALTQWVPEACKLETNTAKAIYQLARHFAPEQVQLLYQIALQGRKDLPFANDARSAFEMTLLRMMTFAPVEPVGERETVIQQAPVRTVPDAGHQATSAPLAQAEQPADTVFEAAEQNAEPAGQAEASDELQQLASEAEQLIDEAEDFRQQSEALTQPSSQPPHYDEPPQDYNAYQQYDNNPPDEHMPPPADYPPAYEEPAEPQSEAPAQKEQATVSNTAAMLALRQRLKQQAAEDKAEAAKKPATTSREFKPSLVAKAAQNGKSQPQSEATETAQPTPGNANVTPQDESYGHQQAEADSPPPWVLENSQDMADEPVNEAQGSDTNVDDGVEQTDSNSLPPQPAAEKPATFDPNQAANVLFETYSNLPAYLENGDKLLVASQIDKWSALIEAMPIAGLLKQVALHSLCERTEDKVLLRLDPAQEHLVNETTASQLSTAMSEVLQSPVTVQLEFAEVTDTPFQIQQQINTMRQRHARQVIQSDDVIRSVVGAFNAEVLEDSIQPR
ncbi:MAG: DNA polymerase III subunit gamma/tau [Gammaproteobacteria bacterium]|nr:DNA polymerase III subunit gamma/tau [Gammaproteobacteria bacterium]